LLTPVELTAFEIDEIDKERGEGGVAMSNTMKPALPTNPYLESGPSGAASEMRVISGYPIWNLIDAWMAAGYADAEVLSAYGLDPQEWAAAKQYYLDHKAVFDAQLIRNLEPNAGDLPAGISTAEEFFAWIGRQQKQAHP
jgi:hypothetical protein